MKFFVSYGLALVIVAVLAFWLATGTLVIPGRGPGNGEVSVAEAIEGQDGGPITQALESTGLVKPVEHHEGPDPELSIAERQADTVGTEAKALSVRIETYTVKPMPIEVPLRGRTRARAHVSVMPQTSGTVEQVHVIKGQKVAQGDLLCTLDRGTRQGSVDQAAAALAQANAGLEKAQSDFETNKTLRDKGLSAANTSGQFESALKAAQAAVSAAETGLAQARAELDRTAVTAPVSGVVQDPLASVGSLLAQGSPCATIVQLDPMLFVGSVPESRIGYARLGLPATVTTITGETVNGEVSFLASTADAATRSFAVEIEIPNADGKVLDGLTASAIVDVGTAPAHLVPQSVLTLDDEGVLGVRTVEDSLVAFYPVTILKDTREGIWITGLKPRADVITVGQEYVQVGQLVDARHAGEDVAESEPAKVEASH